MFGCIRNAASRITFSAITCIHFFFISSPSETAPTAAGRKSRNMNETGFPIAIARKVPIVMLKPPMYGPSIIPYIGAITSDSENAAPDAPIIGTVGIILSTAYRAVNIEMSATIFVFVAPFSMLTNCGHL